MFQLWGRPFFYISFYILCFYYRGPFFRHFSLFIFSLNCNSAFLIQTHAPYSEPAPTYLAAPQVDVQQKNTLLPVVGILYYTGGAISCGLSQ